MGKYLFLLLISFSLPVFGLEAVTLKLERMQMQNWQLQGIEIDLRAINNTKQHLGLAIKKLVLPKPLDDLQLIDIRCSQFIWGNNKIHCQQGKASVQSKRFNSPQLNFSFLISEQKSLFSISELKLLKGVFDLQAEAKLNQWKLQLNGKDVELTLLQQLLMQETELSSGNVKLDLKAEGHDTEMEKIKGYVNIKNLSLQTKDGTKATENLILNSEIKASRLKKNWYWQQYSVFKQGNIYVEPLYLENKNTDISLKSSGVFNPQSQRLEIDNARFTHPKAGSLEAHASIQLEPFMLSNGKVYADIQNLQTATQIYLHPILETSNWKELLLKGHLNAGITLHNNEIEHAYLLANQLQLQDSKQRFDVKDGVISLNWDKDKNFTKASTISWQQFDLFSIPLPRSYLSFLLKDKQISLLKAVEIPLLGGDIQIKKFNWQATENKGPNVVFAGKINHISLEKLTAALETTELSGHLSGDIPGVHYEAGKLSLEGGLKINLFDGEIKIKQLALSGFMSDFPQFYSDIEINHLDLDLLTQKFKFGGMKGKLSGYVNDLYMENWQPIQFYAWLGTPENDDSKHQISQKAVENLASIGGGGAVDLISRTFLGMFDNFDYDKMGLGCYLHNGVCQLMGVEAAGERGYYIVKGGGLPRIDVMGYNTRIDWEVLWERLSRVTKTEDVVIE